MDKGKRNERPRCGKVETALRGDRRYTKLRQWCIVTFAPPGSGGDPEFKPTARLGGQWLVNGSQGIHYAHAITSSGHDFKPESAQLVGDVVAVSGPFQPVEGEKGRRVE